MELTIDPDVKSVAEFMQGSMPAAKLISVASAVAALAPSLWGHFEAEEIVSLRLMPSPLSEPRAEHTQQVAKSPGFAGDAGDDSAVAAS